MPACLARTLGSKDQRVKKELRESSPLLDSDLLLPDFTPQPPGRAFSHLQLGLPDVTAQGSRMSSFV